MTHDKAPVDHEFEATFKVPDKCCVCGFHVSLHLPLKPEPKQFEVKDVVVYSITENGVWLGTFATQELADLFKALLKVSRDAPSH